MALELIGGAFLNAILNMLFDRMVSPEIVSFFRKKDSINMLLKRLRFDLLSVHVVLNDAEEKQVRDAAVMEWLNELKDVAYDADDLLDKIYTEAGTTANKVQILVSFPTKLYEEVEHKLKDILENLDLVIKKKDLLHLKVGKKFKMPHQTPSSSVIEACDVYGRNNEKEDIIQLMMSHRAIDDNICVIPIVGMGGIGKTTLAQLVYNDDRVQKEFDLKVWVYVSEKFDVCKITKALLEGATSCSSNVEDLDSHQKDLKMYLMKKKFLFVLDNVWNENYEKWDKLRSPFKKAGAEGSKIIVTTRSGKVASIMQTVPSYNLRELSSEDSWQLFAKHAFGYRTSNFSFGYRGRNLEKIGKEIVKKCKGLPLAVKTLAGLLRSKSEIKEWYKVLNSEIWDLQDHESNILPALRLSYHYLPSHLKRCFAYCSIFPKEYEYEKEKLILLWMAEGLLQQSKRHRRIEEVGDEYFSELVSRSFFQPHSKRDKSCFVMHHLVNDLAQYVSGTFSVRLEGNISNEVGERTRHLSHIITHSSSYVNLETISKANRLRTFLHMKLLNRSISCKIPHDQFMKLRYLRVLSLVDLNCCFSLPDSIGELKHLRYLDLSGTIIVVLPQSICTLYNLQTLKLEGCSFLRQLPTDLHNLVQLRYLDITGTCLGWMPLKMSKLRNLQKLSDFFIGENGSSIGELGEISDIQGSLFIHNIKNIVKNKASEKAKLKEKQFLEKLYMDWGGSGDTDDSHHEKKVLDSLQPHTNLKELGIYKYPGTEFPIWLGDHSFGNIVSLELKDCKYCCSLPPLGQLSSLKELWIIKFDGLVTVDSHFYGNGNYSSSAAIEYFPALEILRFEYMSGWEKWHIPSGTAFPRLRELHIESCPRLTGDLPCNLPTLTLIVMRDCRQLLSSLPLAPTMRVINIENCGKLEFPLHVPQSHHSLTSLYLHGSCDSLKFLPLDLCPSLKSLDISFLGNLEALTVSVPEAGPPKLSSLRRLCISHCPKFVSFPKGGFHAPNLTLLNIEFCSKLTSLPEQMDVLIPCLKELQLFDCPKIKSLPDMNWLTNLRSVSIQNCYKFMPRDLEWNVSNLTDITDLTRFVRPATIGFPSTIWTSPESRFFRWQPASDCSRTSRTHR